MVDEDPIKGVLLPWVSLAKGQLCDGMAQVEVLVREGHQVMHVHVALLKRLARGKVYVSSHLATAAQHKSEDTFG